jgi:5-formyltetrahydrofolate cyclo-ligase
LKKSAKLRQKYKIIPNISREDLYSESKSLGLNMKKAEIRKIVTAERSQLSEKACAEREAAILSFLRPLLREGSVIASFKAIPHRKEISLDSLEGSFAFPRVTSEVAGTMEMVYSDQFANSRWGIPEPVGGRVVEPAELDVVLIPLLAFDAKGHRVGYGKGFYDRYLATCRPDCLKIGISFFESLAPIDDVEAHDIALDMAICPTQVYDFR